MRHCARRARRSGSRSCWRRSARPTSSSGRSCRCARTSSAPDWIEALEKLQDDAPRLPFTRDPRAGRDEPRRHARGPLRLVRPGAARHRVDRADASRAHEGRRRGGRQGPAAGHRVDDALGPRPALSLRRRSSRPASTRCSSSASSRSSRNSRRGCSGSSTSTRSCRTCWSSSAISTPNARSPCRGRTRSCRRAPC